MDDFMKHNGGSQQHAVKNVANVVTLPGAMGRQQKGNARVDTALKMLVIAACLIVVSWCLLSRLKPHDERTPTMLVGNEMGAWMNTEHASKRASPLAQDEPLFTQLA